jgi:hypothetical protein
MPLQAVEARILGRSARSPLLLLNTTTATPTTTTNNNNNEESYPDVGYGNVV